MYACVYVIKLVKFFVNTFTNAATDRGMVGKIISVKITTSSHNQHSVDNSNSSLTCTSSDKISLFP